MTVDYRPIPIYGEIEWDLTSEALNAFMLAPLGSGKTLFLEYICGMVLKRGHKLYVIDPKHSGFGATFRQVGCEVASDPDEIIEMLTKLVNEMMTVNSEVFDTPEALVKDKYTFYNMPAHVLVFDEVINALESCTDKKDKKEMERLLGLLARLGRSAGFALFLSAQRIMANDLPRSITENLLTRFVIGSQISEELFHLATGRYLKDLPLKYLGNVGKGYALTTKTGLEYFETPLMHYDSLNHVYFELIKKYHTRGENGESN